MPKIIITGAARFHKVVPITLNTERKEFPIGQEIEVHPDYAAALRDANVEFTVLGALKGEGDGAASAGVADAAPANLAELGASAPDTLVDKFPENTETVDASADGTPASDVAAKVNDLTAAPAELKSAHDTPLPTPGLTAVELDADGKPVPAPHPGDDNDRIEQSGTEGGNADEAEKAQDAAADAAKTDDAAIVKTAAKRQTAAKTPAKKPAAKKASATK